MKEKIFIILLRLRVVVLRLVFKNKNKFYFKFYLLFIIFFLVFL